jgi:hypothetical protein
MVPSLHPTSGPSLPALNPLSTTETPTVKWTLRLLATSTVLSVGGFIASNTTLAEDVGLDVWNVPDLQDRVAACESLETEIDRKNATVARRIDQRLEAVADLLDGRITGEEAHARFLDANLSHPKATEFLRGGWAGRSDEEKTARQLVMFVTVSRHPRAAEVAAELECELVYRFAAE